MPNTNNHNNNLPVTAWHLLIGRSGQLVKSITSALILTGLLGCSSMSGHPDLVMDGEQRLQTLVDNYLDRSNVQSLLSRYMTDNSTVSRENRNRIIFSYMEAIDIVYHRFKRDVYSEGTSVNFGLETSGVVVGAAGSLFTGADVSRILSGLSAAIAGTQTAYNKNFYFDQTLPAIISNMEANRSLIKTQIYTNSNNTVEQYTLEQALFELEQYFQAGTMPNAISNIVQDAGQRLEKAEVRFNDNVLDRTDEFLAPTAINRAINITAKLKDLDEDFATRLLADAVMDFESNVVAMALRTQDIADVNSNNISPTSAKNALSMILTESPLIRTDQAMYAKWLQLLDDKAAKDADNEQSE